ncbi:hypothetical protein D3C76_1223690 [compost metagenome]
MPNGDRRTGALSKFHGAIKLEANIGFILRVIEEHFALNHLHARTLGGAHRLAITDGHAVEKIEIVALQRLHHFLHPEQAGGHRAAHMVVQPNRKRHFAIGVTDNALDLVATHVRAQGVFFQRLFAERCHRQVDEDLMPAVVGFGRHFTGVGCIG